MPLRDFQSSFGLECKKEVMDHKIFTQDFILDGGMMTYEALEGEAPEEGEGEEMGEPMID